jgi:hypothetical protein
MKAVSILVVLFVGLLAAIGSEPSEPKKIECRGVIVEFVRDGFHGSTLEGRSDRFDITWVVVKAPEEFAGVRQMLLSRSPDGKSPFGKVGEVISFTTFKSTLEAEKKPPNQSLQPTAASGRG